MIYRFALVASFLVATLLYMACEVEPANLLFSLVVFLVTVVWVAVGDERRDLHLNSRRHTTG